MAKTWEPQELNPDIVAGDTVSKFGHTFEWTAAHLKGIELEKLRQEGDPLADAALQHLTGVDRVARLHDLTKSNGCPEDVRSFSDQLHAEPEWFCHDQIRRGQEFFWSYQPLCMLVLLNASLVGGFGMRRIVSTLRCTNYLGREDTARRRLMETALMVCDVMSFGELAPGKRGWRAAVNVRLMHAQVRKHVLRVAAYNAQQDGIPVNQEDMLSTLIVFSATVVVGLRQMGVAVTAQQAEDYVAAWRYIGYLLGVAELHHFASYASAIVVHESILMHMLDPDETCIELAHNVLMSCSYKAPMHTTFHGSVAVTRHLLGHDWADRLGLPRVPLHSLIVPVRIAIVCKIMHFVACFRKNWLMALFQTQSYRILNQILEHKQPTYKVKSLPSPSPRELSQFLSVSDSITLLLSVIFYLIIFSTSVAAVFKAVVQVYATI